MNAVVELKFETSYDNVCLSFFLLLLFQLAEMEARVVAAETRAEIAEEKVKMSFHCPPPPPPHHHPPGGFIAELHPRRHERIYPIIHHFIQKRNVHKFQDKSSALQYRSSSSCEIYLIDLFHFLLHRCR